MSKSDFLMILSILVTLITVTIANNKKLWLYKFSNWSIFIGILWGLCINYLIFYEELPSVLQASFMEFDNGLRPNYWAYIIAVVGLLLLMFYIAKCKYFPRKNWDKIVNYYRDLITENPVLLIAAIEKYHLKSIEQLLKANKASSTNNPTAVESLSRPKRKMIEAFFNKWRGDELSSMVWSDIILTEGFVCQCARIRPLFLLRIFAQYRGDKDTNVEKLIQLFFKEFIKSKNPVFIRELEEFFNRENEPIINQAKKKTFFKYIFQKDFLWLTKYEIVRAIGEEAEKEIATEWASFAKKTNEWGNGKYQQTISYQCLRLYALQYLYLSEYMDKFGGKECENRLPFDLTLAHLCNAIRHQTSIVEDGTYADKFIFDCRDMIHRVLCAIGTKYNTYYVMSLLHCDLGITKQISEDTSNICQKDATIKVMEQYILLSEVHLISPTAKKEYLNYLKMRKKDLKYWKEALAEVHSQFQKEDAYNELKGLFADD